MITAKAALEASTDSVAARRKDVEDRYGDAVSKAVKAAAAEGRTRVRFTVSEEWESEPLREVLRAYGYVTEFAEDCHFYIDWSYR